MSGGVVSRGCDQLTQDVVTVGLGGGCLLSCFLPCLLAGFLPTVILLLDHLWRATQERQFYCWAAGMCHS